MTHMENKNDGMLADLISDNIHRCSKEERNEFFFTLLGIVQIAAPDAIVRAAKWQSTKLAKKLLFPLDETA
jgi:hypothetical protein